MELNLLEEILIKLIKLMGQFLLREIHKKPFFKIRFNSIFYILDIVHGNKPIIFEKTPLLKDRVFVLNLKVSFLIENRKD